MVLVPAVTLTVAGVTNKAQGSLTFATVVGVYVGAIVDIQTQVGTGYHCRVVAVTSTTVTCVETESIGKSFSNLANVTVGDKLYMPQQLVVLDGAVTAQQAASPTVTWQDPRGTTEMDGDGDYPGPAGWPLGFSQQIADGASFNRIQMRVWATDVASDVEWRLWVKDTNATFSLATTPDVSGTVPAAKFPHANTLYSLDLGTTINVPAGKYVFVVFRASNGSAMNIRKWAYDAAQVRHGFVLRGVADWNGTFSYSSYGSGGSGNYGQTAIRLWAVPSNAAVGISYDPVTAGLASTTVQGAVDEIAARTASAPTLVMAPITHVTEGREVSLYFDNLLPEGAEEYLWDVSGGPSVAVHQNERVKIVSAGAISPTTLTVTAYDRRTGALRATGTTSVVGAAAAAGTGQTPKVICIGDSLTNAGVYTQELVTIASGDPMSIALYGTRGSGSNKHEGRGGWTVATYTSNYTDAYGSNPFWIGGAVNFPQYLTNNSIPVPDVVSIMLGINDVAGQTSDANALAKATADHILLDVLIASIKAAGPSVKVLLLTTTPPSATQDAFGHDYGIGLTRWRVKRNIAIWARALIAKYSGQTANRIYIGATHANLDTVNNMLRAAAENVNSRSTIQVTRQSNGVHPDTPGYKQLADTYWSALKVLFT